MKTSTQTAKIKQLLSDGAFHCTTEMYSMFIADPRRRLCDLRDKGIELESRWCIKHPHKMKEWRMLTAVPVKRYAFDEITGVAIKLF